MGLTRGRKYNTYSRMSSRVNREPFGTEEENSLSRGRYSLRRDERRWGPGKPGAGSVRWEPEKLLLLVLLPRYSLLPGSASEATEVTEDDDDDDDLASLLFPFAGAFRLSRHWLTHGPAPEAVAERGGGCCKNKII